MTKRGPLDLLRAVVGFVDRGVVPQAPIVATGADIGHACGYCRGVGSINALPCPGPRCVEARARAAAPADPAALPAHEEKEPAR